MKTLALKVQRFLASEDGPTAVEYAVMLALIVIAWRGLRIAANAQDRFGAFLAIGLTTMMAVQGLINISVVLGLLPTKGLPLPFVSSGGSSMLVNLIGLGILLNVSQHAAIDS